MKIAQILSDKKIVFSFEIFPPKPSAAEVHFNSVMQTAKTLSGFAPDFISVTYGTGGGKSNHTADIAETIQKMGTPALAHLTCISSTKDEILQVIDNLKAKKIENVLALRGDLQVDSNDRKSSAEKTAYKYASDLILHLKKHTDFCIGGACYPEGHPESSNKMQDLDYLKRKVDCGVDFLTTQMFFDNNMLYSFLYRTQAAGIRVPIIAGIMPVINVTQIKRMILLSNAYMPRELLEMIATFENSPEAMRQAGIAYATHQIIDLIIQGVRGIHIYTMNKPDIAREILNNVQSILDSVNVGNN